MSLHLIKSLPSSAVSYLLSRDLNKWRMDSFAGVSLGFGEGGLFVIELFTLFNDGLKDLWRMEVLESLITAKEPYLGGF